MLRVHGSSVSDVVLGWIRLGKHRKHHARTPTGLWINAETLSDLCYPLRPECAFGICGTRLDISSPWRGQRTDVCYLAFGSTHVLWQLCNDRHCMRHLRLSTTELAKDLADAHSLEATTGVSTCSTVV
jgi:hypothetical protein